MLLLQAQLGRLGVLLLARQQPRWLSCLTCRISSSYISNALAPLHSIAAGADVGVLRASMHAVVFAGEAAVITTATASTPTLDAASRAHRSLGASRLVLRRPRKKLRIRLLSRL